MNLILQLSVISFIVLLVVIAVYFKSYMTKRRLRKGLGSALIVVSSILGGTPYDPGKKPESEKFGQHREP